MITMVPTFALFRGLLVLRDSVAFNAPGLTTADLSAADVDMVDVYLFLIVQWAVFMLLALYCEMVVPTGIGVKRHPLFFLQVGSCCNTFHK